MANPLLELLNLPAMYWADENQQRLFGGRLDDVANTTEATLRRGGRKATAPPTMLPPQNVASVPAAGGRVTPPLQNPTKDDANLPVRDHGYGFAGIPIDSWEPMRATTAQGDANLPSDLSGGLPAHTMTIRNGERMGAVDYGPDGRGTLRPITPTPLLTSMEQAAGRNNSALNLDSLRQQAGLPAFRRVMPTQPTLGLDDPYYRMDLLNAQREDALTKMMVERQTELEKTKMMTEAQLAAQKPEHTRILEAIIGQKLASGQQITAQELAEMYQAIQAVTPHLGGATGVAPPPAASGTEPLVKQKFAKPEELEGHIKQFHSEGGQINAEELGKVLQGNQLLRENLPDLIVALKRRTIPGGVPNMQRNVANEIARLAQASDLMSELADVKAGAIVKLPNNWELVFGQTPMLRNPNLRIPLGTDFSSLWKRSDITPSFPWNKPIYKDRISPLLQFLEAAR